MLNRNHSAAYSPTRRELLQQSAAGFGWLALAGLLGAERARAESPVVDPRQPLAPRLPHFTPRAKRVIFLFMHGGPSHVDTFDYKPQLARDNGQPLPFAKRRVQSAVTGNLLASPWKFRPYGQSGIHVSDLFPHVGSCIDDVCLINSIWGSNSRHGGALLELHTGSDTFVRPSMGSWVTYGLGSENQDLPGYVTICPTLTHGGVNNWSSAFLPAAFQGTPIGNAFVPAVQAQIPFITNNETPREVQRAELDLLGEMNQEHLARSGPDLALEARISSFELAFNLQRAAPHLQDLADESAATLEMYGINGGSTENFGRQCLLARRFCEAGVRFVQVSHSYKWDQHENLRTEHERNALEVDRPIAGLLTDLKSRGLLEDTLVLWGGEFGRSPTAQGTNGRDHHPAGYTMWLAGGGVRGGLQFGKTDEYGYYAIENKVHLHDLHATILHLLGLDHLRLTYQYLGRDFRLTDVHGEVIHGLLA